MIVPYVGYWIEVFASFGASEFTNSDVARKLMEDVPQQTLARVGKHQREQARARSDRARDDTRTTDEAWNGAMRLANSSCQAAARSGRLKRVGKATFQNV